MTQDGRLFKRKKSGVVGVAFFMCDKFSAVVLVLFLRAFAGAQFLLLDPKWAVDVHEGRDEDYGHVRPRSCSCENARKQSGCW